MQKSKSWLKSLLIVVMAIMLVFSLVACNKGDDGNSDPVTESSADYFTALWNSTKPIGTTEIADNADLSVSFGFELSIDTFSEKADGIYQQIDLGFDVKAVIGRTAASADKTAVKIRIYDPTDANYEEILTLYAFANDLDNLYIDFAGKNIKLPSNLESLIWKEIFNKEGNVGNGIVDGLNAGLITIGGQKKSINDVINMITSNFGSDWSLNSLVDNILTLANFDASKIIKFLKDKGLEVPLTSVFGVSSLEDLLDDGKLNILKILTSDALSTFLAATRQKVNGATVHRANISQIAALALGFIGDAGTTISEMVGEGGEVALSFTEKGGAIQDLTIYAQLLALSVEVPYEEGTTKLIPELSLKITEFSIETLGDSNGVALKSGKTYSETVAFDETLELAASGIKILGYGKDNSDISLNGKIIVNAKGQLDIVNTNALIADTENNITENKTKANITVQLINRDQAPVDIAQFSYANGKIAGKVSNGLDLSFLGDEYAGKTAFVYDLGNDFNVADMVQGYIRQLIGMIKDGNQGGDNDGEGGTQAADVPAPNRTLATKVKFVLEIALQMVSTENNHLNISTTNILKTIVDIKESVNPGSGTPTNPGSDKWTEENRIVAIVNSLLNPELTDTDLNGCLDILKQQMEVVQSGDYRAALNACKNVLFRVLYLVGPSIRFQGVQTENLNADDYASFKKNGDQAITAEDTDLMIYINNIKAVLGTQITVDGDLQGGINASVNVQVAEATLSASTSFTIVDSANFTDLYKEYEDAADKSGWAIITDEQE